VIGTAIMNIKFSSGAKSIKYAQSPVRTAAKTPVTRVAKLLPKYPIINLKNSLFIIVMVITKN
jgi:hypothetical protein